MKHPKIPFSMQEKDKQAMMLLTSTTLHVFGMVWSLPLMLFMEMSTTLGQGLIPGPSSLCLSLKSNVCLFSKPCSVIPGCHFQHWFIQGVDTCASVTMSGNKDLFEDLVLKNLGEYKEVDGGLAIASIGTLAIKIDNNESRTHLIWILNSIYVPYLPMPLLCPQHWAQQVVTSHWALLGSMFCYTMVKATMLE